MRAWIGLGGNREDSAALIERALERLAAEPGITVARRSSTYRSPPWGILDQPDFVNAVAVLETSLAARDVLAALLAVERSLGRTRGPERWGPRCIDLDLLAYEDVVLHEDGLDLPHPRMHERAFVLVPLLELDPAFVIPGRGAAVDCLGRLDRQDVAAVEPLTTD